MDDREFFDKLLQMWAKTTAAEDRFWGYEETLEEQFDIFAHSHDDKEFVGYVENEADADFITAVHGCFPDLIRRIYIALDEADRLDEEMDAVQGQLMELELRVMELKSELKDANG
jgi:hypothetical protein